MAESPYQILDDVLSIMPTETKTNVVGIINSLKERGVAIDRRWMDQILLKLITEGYITIEEVQVVRSANFPTATYYQLSFEGQLLIRNGGYVMMKKVEKSNNERMARYDRYVFYGAIIGGAYALFEIWKDALELWFHYRFYNPFR